MNILFAFDCLSGKGIGHCFRSVGLAEWFKEIIPNVNCLFLVNGELPSEYEAELPGKLVSESICEEKVRFCDLIVIDSYDQGFFETFHLWCVTNLLIVHDDQIKLPAHSRYNSFILNHKFLPANIGRDLSADNWFCGPGFFPVRKKLRDVSKWNLDNLEQRPHRIPCFFSGAFGADYLRKLVRLLDQLENDGFELELFGKGVGDSVTITQLRLGEQTRFHHSLSSSSFAIGGLGINTFERVYLGVPAIGVSLIENQIDNAAAVQKLEVGSTATADTLLSVLTEWLGELQKGSLERFKIINARCSAIEVGSRMPECILEIASRMK